MNVPGPAWHVSVLATVLQFILKALESASGFNLKGFEQSLANQSWKCKLHNHFDHLDSEF